MRAGPALNQRLHLCRSIRGIAVGRRVRSATTAGEFAPGDVGVRIRAVGRNVRCGCCVGIEKVRIFDAGEQIVIEVNVSVYYCAHAVVIT